MNGSAISMATKIARIFGTNTKVISWIWVSAWNSEMATPTDQPDQHQRARHKHQRDDRVARHIEHFGTGHVQLLSGCHRPRGGSIPSAMVIGISDPAVDWIRLRGDDEHARQIGIRMISS